MSPPSVYKGSRRVSPRYDARMIIVSVLYPKTSESHFDLEYYLEKHTPLLKARMTVMGLEKVDLFRGSGALGGGEPAFAVIAHLQFTSLEHLQAALAAHGAEIIGDIPEFTDVQPVIQINEPV
jgi:uncharacterized protein (TIGR02118 family)